MRFALLVIIPSVLNLIDRIALKSLGLPNENWTVMIAMMLAFVLGAVITHLSFDA